MFVGAGGSARVTFSITARAHQIRIRGYECARWTRGGGCSSGRVAGGVRRESPRKNAVALRLIAIAHRPWHNGCA